MRTEKGQMCTIGKACVICPRSKLLKNRPHTEGTPGGRSMRISVVKIEIYVKHTGCLTRLSIFISCLAYTKI